MDGLFKVSTKAAIYTQDMHNVLVIRINGTDYGLPGGHIHEGETPDAAIARELYEETGLTGIRLQRKDFFVHANGKVILAYTGSVQDSVTVASQQAKSEGDPVWVSKVEFKALSIEQGYKRFVLSNW